MAHMSDKVVQSFDSGSHFKTCRPIHAAKNRIVNPLDVARIVSAFSSSREDRLKTRKPHDIETVRVSSRETRWIRIQVSGVAAVFLTASCPSS
jgi:hypothetical protein